MTDLSKRYSDNVKDNCRVICFCRDSEPLSGVHIDDIAKRGYAKPRMWAQYGDGHKGVCLVLDKENLIEQIKNTCAEAIRIYHGNVTYRDRGLLPQLEEEAHYMMNADYIEKYGFDKFWMTHLDQFRHRLLFEKMGDWKDEREYRFVALFPEPRETFIDITDCLVGVIFGDAVVYDGSEEIIDLLIDTKVEIQRIQWKNCGPWYDYGSLRYDKKLRSSPWYKQKKSS